MLNFSTSQYFVLLNGFENRLQNSLWDFHVICVLTHVCKFAGIGRALKSMYKVTEVRFAFDMHLIFNIEFQTADPHLKVRGSFNFIQTIKDFNQEHITRRKPSLILH